MTRERLLKIITNHSYTEPLADAIMDELDHEKKTNPDDGKWVCRNKRMGWYGTTTIGRPSRNVDEAEVFYTNIIPGRFDYKTWEVIPLSVAREMYSSDLITIGNGAKVKPGTIGFWFVDKKENPPRVKKLAMRVDVDFLKEYRNMIFLTQSEAEAQLVADGFIQIADGWVKRNSETMVHFVCDCEISSDPANTWGFNHDSECYFLSREKAQAFLDSERRRDQVQIGNRKRIDKDSTEWWLVSSKGFIHVPNELKVADCLDKEELEKYAFASLPEAEAKSAEIHKGLGHFKTADGVWLSTDKPIYYLGGDVLYFFRESIGVSDEIRKNSYSTPESAAAAWLKLMKEV